MDKGRLKHLLRTNISWFLVLLLALIFAPKAC